MLRYEATGDDMEWVTRKNVKVDRVAYVAAEGAGLRAIAEGFAAMELTDNERLRYGFVIYDAHFAVQQQNANTKRGTAL